MKLIISGMTWPVSSGDSEDHAADEARYACMSRPWVAVKEKPKPEDVSGYEVYHKTTAAEDWKQF